MDKADTAFVFSQTMIRFGFFSMTQSSVQMPVGPAPMINTVSSSLISEIRAAQKTGGKNISDQQSLTVCNMIRDFI